MDNIRLAVRNGTLRVAKPLGSPGRAGDLPDLVTIPAGTGYPTCEEITQLRKKTKNKSGSKEYDKRSGDLSSRFFFSSTPGFQIA